MGDTYSALFAHLVWATWERLPLLVGEVERHVYRSLDAKCVALDVEVMALGGVEDHVHLVVRMPPTLAVAHLVKHLKGASSHLLTHDVAPDAFFKWQGGYGAFSVGPRDVPVVRNYVMNQKQHHRLGTTIPAYEPQLTPDHATDDPR